jgi:hypothetical protein
MALVKINPLHDTILTDRRFHHLIRAIGLPPSRRS